MIESYATHERTAFDPGPSIRSSERVPASGRDTKLPKGFRPLAEDAPFVEILERELAPLRSDAPRPIEPKPEIPPIDNPALAKPGFPGAGSKNPWEALAEREGVDDAEALRELRLREAAEGFESLFYRQMVQQFRKSVSENGLFGSGPGKHVYEGMFDDLLSKELASAGRLGIADFFLRSVR